MPGPRRSDDDDVTPPEWTCPACGRSGPLEIGEQLPNDTLAYCHHTPDRPLAAYLAPPDDPGGPARRVRTEPSPVSFCCTSRSPPRWRHRTPVSSGPC
ncbi:MAG: hypothetical protein JWN52_4685 [Actinomycetia bacterium]|nr:hypothetical protein [Actinomycetes bacterium]